MVIRFKRKRTQTICCPDVVFNKTEMMFFSKTTINNKGQHFLINLW